MQGLVCKDVTAYSARSRTLISLRSDGVRLDWNRCSAWSGKGVRLRQNAHVTADEIVQFMEKLQRWAPSIDPFFSWLSGLPGETHENMQRTFELMDQMAPPKRSRAQRAVAIRRLLLHELPNALDQGGVQRTADCLGGRCLTQGGSAAPQARGRGAVQRRKTRCIVKGLAICSCGRRRGRVASLSLD